MQNLCLLSGAEQEQVLSALLKFAEAAGVARRGAPQAVEASELGESSESPKAELKLADCVWEETQQGDWVLTEGLDDTTSALVERCVLEQMRRAKVQSDQ